MKGGESIQIGKIALGASYKIILSPSQVVQRFPHIEKVSREERYWSKFIL